MPRRRHLSLLLLTLPLGLGACGTPSRPRQEAAGFNPAPTTLVPAAAHVRRVILHNGQSAVTLDGPAGDGGGPGQEILPIVAYRKLCSVPPTENLGLTAPNVTVSAGGGTTTAADLSFGNRNFTGAGVYTSRAGDDCVYLVPAAQAERVAALVDGQAARAMYGATGPPVSRLLEQQDEKEDDASETNAWVVQSRRRIDGQQ
jgi:hypothetical protein